MPPTLGREALDDGAPDAPVPIVRIDDHVDDQRVQDAVADDPPGPHETLTFVSRYGIPRRCQRSGGRRDREAPLRVPARGPEQADERERVRDLRLVLDQRRRGVHQRDR